MITFTEEERELIGLFKSNSRVSTICALQNTLSEVKDENMISVIKSVLSKLMRIDSAGFEQLCIN